MKKFNFRILEIIVFISGACVLILELLASRILAPFLGNSIFVWASLIGIILGALSAGYYLGGYYSKKNPSMKFISAVLFAAGIFIFGIIFIKDPILVLAEAIGVRWGSVLATLALFTIPSVLMGTISPYALRLKIDNIQTSGGVAGNLYALSTIGSIVGSFLAGFYLIPTFHGTDILAGISVALILTALLAGFSERKFFLAFWLLIVAVAWIIVPFPSPYLYESDSAYNHIRVADTTYRDSGRPVRVLFLATETHSLMYLDGDDLVAQYHKLYHLDSLFKPGIKKALTLGGGAYIGPRDFLQRYPNATMTVVEIDPEVTKTATRYFKLDPGDPRLNIIHEDARIFINQSEEKFDVIYGDAFASYYSVPFQLTTQEALNEISRLLTDDGILVMNVISSLRGKSSAFLQSEYQTLQEVFPQIYLFPDRYYRPTDPIDKPQNIIVIASKNPQRLTTEQLLAVADPEQQKLLEQWWQDDIEANPKIKKLTDDFAPVDFYIAQFL